MHPSTQHKQEKRAAQARINGAKSQGPKTAEGLNRARTAPLQHGLYATEASLASTVDNEKYAELRAQYQSVFAPENLYIEDKVDDLVAYRWELNRLREVRREYLASIFNETGAVTDTEAFAVAKGSILEKFDLRIRRCNLEISRIERDIVRLTKLFQNRGGSHKSLETITPAPLQWPPYPETAETPAGTTHSFAQPPAKEPPN